jgi:hypothetical protein
MVVDVVGVVETALVRYAGDSTEPAGGMCCGDVLPGNGAKNGASFAGVGGDEVQ